MDIIDDVEEPAEAEQETLPSEPSEKGVKRKKRKCVDPFQIIWCVFRLFLIGYVAWLILNSFARGMR